MICIPNFVSWVVVAGIWYSILSYNGPVNHALQSIGMIDKPIMFMESDKLFLPIIVSTDLWKSLGYSTIFYMAAIATIPQDQYEAAKIDGASNLTIFRKIILPLAKPIITFVALTNFMGPWFDFIFPQLILRSSDKKTLALGLFEWIQKNQNTQFTRFAAGAILVAIPITLLFVYLQKHIVSGLSSGAVKS